MTQPAPDPRLRARRVALVIVLWSFLGILGALSVFAGHLEGFYTKMEMRYLPAPTELFLAVGSGVRHPVGMVLCTVAAAGFSAWVLRGGADSRLKPLTIAAVVATVLGNGLFLLSIYMPFVKVHQHVWK